MKFGFVVSGPNWEVIRESINRDVISIMWHRETTTEALDALADEPPELVLVEAAEALATTELVAHCDKDGIRLAALITGPHGSALAESLGIGEHVRNPHDLERIARGLGPERLEDSGRAGPSGEVWSVWGPPGAPGRTTVAISICASLTRRGFRTVLVDADPRGGTVAPALGLLDDVPGFIAACRLARRGELNAQELHRLTTRYPIHPGEMRILTGLTRMMRSGEAPSASTDQVVAKLRESFDLVVMDVGSDLLADPEFIDQQPSDHAQLTSHLVATADAVIAVAEASPVGVARLARSIHDARRLANASLHVVLNGVDPVRKALREEGILSEALWRFAEVSDYCAISRDDVVRRAHMAGVTVAEIPGRHAMLTGLEVTVERILRSRGLPLTPAPRQGAVPVAAPERNPEGRSTLQVLEGLWKKVTALR